MSGFGPDAREEFERQVAEVAAHEWGDPDATRPERDGVDVHCRPDHLDGGHCGVHCRVTDDLSAGAVREAVAAAEDFEPALAEFVVATTATRDGAVHREVRTLSEERADEGRFPVRVLWWGDVARLRGDAARRRGDLEAAERRYREGLEVMCDLDDRSGEARCLEDLGTVALDRGDLDDAEEYYRRSLDCRREADDDHGAARARHRLGRVARERGDWESARDYFRAASESLLEIAAGHDALGALDDLVEALERTGRDDEAVEACAVAIGIADELDRPAAARRFRVRYATLSGRSAAAGTEELYVLALENVVDPDPDAAVAVFDRAWSRRDEVPAGSGPRARAHAAGVFLAALSELYDVERGDEALDPDDVLAAASDPEVDLPDPVAPVAARLRGEDPGVTPDDLDGDVEPDGELAAEDLERLAAAAVLDALG